MNVSRPAQTLVSLLIEHGNGLTAEELTALARTRFRQHPKRIAVLISEAVSAGVVESRGGRLYARAADKPCPVPDSAAVSPLQRKSRVIAIDLESVVRTTATEPYLERRIYQIGAVRVGTDVSWIAECPAFNRYVELPDEQWEITSDRARVAHSTSAVPVITALSELLDFAEDADFLIAYNGEEADFPLLAETLDRENLARMPGVQVDAYYLALAIWPNAPSHRLASLADSEGVTSSDLVWHDALSDATLMGCLLDAMAATLRRWSAPLRDLVAAITPDSPAWRLIREIADVTTGSVAPQTIDNVVAVLESGLSHHRPRRLPGEAPGRPVLVVSDTARTDGKVDPYLLARLSRGNSASRRSEQDEMTAALHEWAAEGAPGLIEAPTGTGKSLAVLAAALEWLAADPGHTAIVATYTKQLQSQLSVDVQKLDSLAPGLLDATDVVKGAGSRLSLRALATVLADASSLEAKRPSRSRFVNSARFRELLVYLLLRLLDSADRVSGWAAHSTDPVDIPVFFSGYAGPVLPLWLESLSQASNGEIDAKSPRPLARYTDVVSEGLAGHRLILANHALLLSHIEDLEQLGDETLLIIDEAHQVEDSATSAMTTALDYREIEDLHGELADWTAGHGAAASAHISESVRELGLLLEQELLPREASKAFDVRSAGAGAVVGSRAATLATPYSGGSQTVQVRSLARVLTRLRDRCDAVSGTLNAFAVKDRAKLGFFEKEQVLGLIERTRRTRDATSVLIDDIETALNGGLPGMEPNQVVFAEELGELAGDLRRYRFRMASAPITLPAAEPWQRFSGMFCRVYYVSATLRVADAWTFIQTRLGLPATINTLALGTPFDLARQAELVCFSDFPSWAEQSDGAMRTMAHQLAGYAAEMIRPGDHGGTEGGAMVLTTARSTAGGTAQYLAAELRRGGDDTPVTSALVSGNQRSVAAFTDPGSGGGILVGTRGLWQGVDIADPARLRLVWINKLPFAPFADPIIEARRAAVTAQAERDESEDPEAIATEKYYLPLAVLQLRQAVGRLIRSEHHRGIVIISDRKIAGGTALRRSYRRAFLGSLDPGLLRTDPDTGEAYGGNMTTMAEGWRRIWDFYANQNLLSPERAASLSTDEALEAHTLLPQTRRIQELALSPQEAERLTACGELADEVARRSALIGGLLRLSDEPTELKRSQLTIIKAAASGRDVLGLLPTGFGKSFCFQLPALVLPGVTIVVSPLVALMQDQALELNRSIGGAVRALVAPMRESASRAGKTEVAEQLTGRADHGIRLVYVSPERLCQTRFRELVREAVKAGRVRRIALDEAHTFVQWGEDFRPSFRRVERFLAELRRDYGLPVTALTATANRTVHAGLRECVFGLAGNPDNAGDERLVTVLENPIRPELAIFRRTIDRAGPSTAAELAEHVVDALDGHAILYCLTVKEVVARHAHLREYLGGTGVRVLRFHGRLTEAEKASVLTQFREAPLRGEEGFTPLIVVATSAFGLGVNRPDVRTVFCASPPTDLAALYQQLGRAGRDAAGTNVGLAFGSTRGLRTVAFMTGQDLSPDLFRRMANAILSCHGILNTETVADRLIGDDLAAGRITLDDARSSRVIDAYTSGVSRVFAALADLNSVTDLGDFPPTVTVKTGELLRTDVVSHEHGKQAGEIVSALLALPARDGHRLGRDRLSIAAVDNYLAGLIPGYREMAPDAPATWQLLADLHDLGQLDVSAAPSRRYVTGVDVRTRTLPPGFSAAMAGKKERAGRELNLLHDFFDDLQTCANRKLASYFGVTRPDECCTSETNRCSACWNHGDYPLGEHRPAVSRAFQASSHDLNKSRDTPNDQRLDEQIRMLVWVAYRGIHAQDLHRALRGTDSWYNPKRGKRIRLDTPVLTSRFFGANPSVTLQQIEGSLDRLRDSGIVASGEHDRWHAVHRGSGHDH